MIRSGLTFCMARITGWPVIRGVVLAGFVAVLAAGTAVAADAPQTIAPVPGAKALPARKTIVDSAVTPAGGGCRQCGPGGCRHAHGGHGHHSGCREGHCVPYCPVRPGQHGFYDTRWRKWPGQGVIPASAQQSATPAVPPKSAPPASDEESFGPSAEDPAVSAPQPVNPGAGQGVNPRDPDPAPVVPAPLPVEPESVPRVVPAPRPEVPAVQDPEPVVEPAAEPEPPKPADVTETTEPETEPAAVVPVEEPAAPEPAPQPAVEKPASEKSAEDNLFDEAATGRAQRVFVASRIGEARQVSSTGVRQVAHQPAAARQASAGRPTAGSKLVPRVSFDPRAETERLESGR
jgi:hypothetical protein